MKIGNKPVTANLHAQGGIHRMRIAGNLYTPTRRYAKTFYFS